MKEATGELNMTVVTIVAIAAIAAVFYAFVWPTLKGKIKSSTACADAVCPVCGASPVGTVVKCAQPGKADQISCPCVKG